MSTRATGAQAGFSLLELMVVTAIFVVLTGVVLASNTRFGNVIILQNLAHDIALTIRQAQVYGIAVKRCDQSVNANCPVIEQQFDVAYGVHFCIPGAQQPLCPGNTFELFVDINSAGDPESGSYQQGEAILANTLSAGYAITSLCAVPAVGGSPDCSGELNVAFRRPEPDACINGTYDSDGDCESIYSRATIVVESNRGDSATILVESTGQISVQ